MCAGTLARFVDNGERVRLIVGFFSDFGPDHQRQGLRAERRDELEQAAKALGVELVPFLEHDEDSFSWSQRWVQTFEAIVSEDPPDVLISHRVADPNHSHSNLGRVARTLSRKNRWTLWEMDQSLPGGIEPDAPSPNLLVDITDQIGQKRSAVVAYASQLERYPGMGDAIAWRDRLNGWQLHMSEGFHYAEAFRVHKAVWI